MMRIVDRHMPVDAIGPGIAGKGDEIGQDKLVDSKVIFVAAGSGRIRQFLTPYSVKSASVDLESRAPRRARTSRDPARPRHCHHEALRRRHSNSYSAGS